LDYLWTLFGRDRRGREIGDSDTITVAFNLTGDHRLEGSVRHGNVLFDINWMIDVRSVVWYWWPREDSLVVPVDTTVLFAVTPFNLDSDSLEYLWTLDGDTIDVEREIEVLFEDMGLHEVVAFVNDGCEADTIYWAVNVVPVVNVPESMSQPIPMKLALYPPMPNPFNSTTTLQFFLPGEMHISLALYDALGRLLNTLSEGMHSAGKHKFTLEAGNLSTGIYMVHLKAMGYSSTSKLLLIK